MSGYIRTFLLIGFALLLISITGCVQFETKTPVKPAAVMSPRDYAVQLQIFLDANNFRPGAVDGRAGEFFGKALGLYNRAHNLPASTVPEIAQITPFVTYTITADDLSRIGTMASEKSEIEKQKSSPYTGLQELLAERFHTTRAFLSALNAGRNIDAFHAGDVVNAPNVATPFRLDALPLIKNAPRDPALVTRTISINVHTRILEVHDGDHLIASFPITPGSSDHPAPIGDWKIEGITTFPWFRYDEGVLERGERTETFYNLPPGPNNPVGILWMQLNRPGDGIHGSPNPETIGRAGSHGCIRLANWDADVIRTLVTVGTPVNIH